MSIDFNLNSLTDRKINRILTRKILQETQMRTLYTAL